MKTTSLTAVHSLPSTCYSAFASSSALKMQYSRLTFASRLENGKPEVIQLQDIYKKKTFTRPTSLKYAIYWNAIGYNKNARNPLLSNSNAIWSLTFAVQAAYETLLRHKLLSVRIWFHSHCFQKAVLLLAPLDNLLAKNSPVSFSQFKRQRDIPSTLQDCRDFLDFPLSGRFF